MDVGFLAESNLDSLVVKEVDKAGHFVGLARAPGIGRSDAKERPGDTRRRAGGGGELVGRSRRRSGKWAVAGGGLRWEWVGGCGGRTGVVLVLPRTPSNVGEDVVGASHPAHLSNPPSTLRARQV